MKYPILYSFKRCPYAMRARMALKLTNIKCEIREVRLNIKLKLFLIKTPIIKTEKIDKDKKISGSIIFILFIITNLRLLLYHNYQLSY